MGRLITETGTSLAIVAANTSEITFFPTNVRIASLLIDTFVSADELSTNTLSANTIVGKWEGSTLQSYQVNIEGVDIKATDVPPNRYLKTNNQGIVEWVEEFPITEFKDLDISNNLTVKGYISAQGNLSANDIDAKSNILSAGVNLLDIFSIAAGSIDGSGTANTVAKFSDSNTITDSNISDNGNTVTIASSLSSGNLFNITNDGDSKFCVAYDGSTTIQGNLSVHGDMHYIDTNVTVTSALSIINSGTGPALYVEQKGTEPIAHFIDKEGDDIIFDDNGRIGLGLFSPEQKLTVAGGISASEGLSAGKTSYFDGNVGIGINSNFSGPPSGKLDVRGTSDGHLFFDTDGGGSSIKSRYNLELWADYAPGHSARFENIYLKTNGDNTRMTLDGCGNVGIGTGEITADASSHPGDKLTVQGNISSSGDLCLVDNGKIRLGDSSDLQIYHDGSNSYISDTGTGGLKVMTGDFYVRNPADADMIYASSGGAAKLYHAGSEKLETTSAGINVTGTITSDGQTIDGDLTVNGSISASEGLSAKNIDSAYNILSAGTDLVDIFAPASGGGYIDGSGTANTIAKFSDSNTIADSSITDNGSIVTVSAPVSGDDYIKGQEFCLGANSRVDNPATNNLGLYANNELGLELVSDTRVCSHHDLTVNGTISASSNLSAGGRFFAPNGSAAAPTFSFSDFPGTGLLMADTDTLGIATRGSVRMAVDESGCVGIGTATPSEKLGVDGSIILRGSTNHRYKVANDSNNNWAEIGNDGTCGQNTLEFFTKSSSVPAMSITNDDKVGLGVTNPGVTLTVQGGISASGGLSAGNLEIIGGSGTTNFLPKFTDSDTLGDSIAYVGSDNINIEGGLSALQGLSADNNIYGGGCINHFVNNVGINVANPSEKLTIQGALSSSNKGVFHKIGLGTNGPDLRLEIDVDAADDGILITANNGARKAVEILAESASNGGADVKLYGGVNNVCGRFRSGNDSFLSGTDFGIGTSSPAAPFHVKSTTSNTKMRLTNDNSTNWDFAVGNTGYYQGNLFISNPAIANEQFTLGSTGNVGINVFNPTEKLTVQGVISSSNKGVFDKIGVGVSSPNAELHVSNSGAPTFRLSRTGTGQIWQQSIDSSGRFLLTEAASEGGTQYNRLGIDDAGDTCLVPVAGNVGVGITSPGEKLTVAGGISASEGLSAGKCSYFTGKVGIGTNSPDTKLHLSETSATQGATLRIDNPGTTNNSCVGIEFVNSSTGVPRSAIMAQRVDSGYNPELIFYTSPTDSLQERMRIDHDGCVGIGTEAPAEKLTVAGGISASEGLSAGKCSYFAGNVDVDGCVGIGTTDPLSPLHICSAGEQLADFQSTDAQAYIRVRDNSDSAYFSSHGGIGSVGGSVGASSNNLNVNLGNGNVGIGTSGPTQKLTVAGGISASDGLSANNINSASSIISAGTDLIDIFGPGGSLSGVDGGGDACYLPVWSDSNTVENSIACQSANLLTVQGSISSNGSICTTGSIIRNPGTTSSGGLCVRDCSNARPWRIYGTGPGGCQVIETSGTSNPIHFGSELGGAINIKTCDTTRMFISGGGHAIGIGSTNPTSTMMFADNCKLAFGNGSDVCIYHDGTDSYVDNGIGDLILRTAGSGDDVFVRAVDDIFIQPGNGASGVTARGGGAVELYYNGGNKKLETTNTGVTVTGNVSASGNLSARELNVPDNGKITLGNSDDLQIYHSGSQSYIQDKGTGGLYLQTNGPAIYLQDTDGNAMAQFSDNGGSFLMYNHALKLGTTNTGIDVTGTVTSDGNTIAGDISASGGLSANNINSASTIISAGTDLTDIFGPGGSAGNINGSGTACYLPVWSDTDTIGNSIACQSTNLLTVQGNISAHGALSATNSTACSYFAGNVGIGTTAPTKELEVSSGGADSPTIKASYNPTNYLEIGHNRINAVSSGGNDSIFLQTAGTTRVGVNMQGNVGIGTGSTHIIDERLTVAGNISASGSLSASGDVNYFAGKVGIGGDPGTRCLYVNGYTAAGGVEFLSGVTYTNQVRTCALEDKTSSGYAKIAFGGSNCTMAFCTDSTSRMFLNASGNLGIGTETPYAYDTTATRLHVTNSGSACCVSEVARFEGSSDADGSGGIIRLGTSNDRGIYLEGGRTGSVPYASIGTTEYDGTKTEGIRVDSAGNVGIGTSSPGEKLTVQGNISASGNGYFACVIAGGYFEEKAAHPSLAKHPTGSLVVIGENGKLELSTTENDKKVFGVTQCGASQPIILGAEPVLVTGNINVGDFITTSDQPGHGKRSMHTIHGAVIAQSMESGTGKSHLVKAMIRKM